MFLSDIGIPRVDPGSNAFHMRHNCMHSCAKKKGSLSVPNMAYVSPEALLTGKAGIKDDIWALGCIITELVTSKHVTDRAPGSTFARNQGAVAQAIAEVAIKDPDMGDLVHLLLEKDSAKRPSAYEIMWKHMRHVAPEIPEEAPPPLPTDPAVSEPNTLHPPKARVNARSPLESLASVPSAGRSLREGGGDC